MICDNTELSTLDNQLNRVYQEALKKSLNPKELKERQKAWQKYWQTECGNSAECVAYQWEKQITRLNNVINSPLHQLEATVFKYELKEHYDDKVCFHMLDVFNSKFSTPWATEPTTYWTGEISPKNGLPVLKPNPAYEELGKYAFPKLPGVEHDARESFEMRHTRQPSSPEFDFIPWREGRRISGKSPSSGKIVSMLAADFDIDNDGKIETVLKTGFFGIMNVYSNAHAGEDTYLVYPQEGVDPTKVEDLRSLSHKARYTINGKFLRPFIFNGETYFTSYEPSFGILEDSDSVEIPETEDMVVQICQKKNENDYSCEFNELCRYQMIAVGSIDTALLFPTSTRK
jgi:hypothetical protein